MGGIVRTMELTRTQLLVVAALTLVQVAHSTKCGGCNHVNSLEPASGCNAYYGSCSSLESESECWHQGFCFAPSSDDCCDTNSGAVWGIIITLMIIICISIICCCLCCKSCPWAKSRASAGQHHQGAFVQQPVNQAQPYGQPYANNQAQPYTNHQGGAPMTVIAQPAVAHPVLPPPQYEPQQGLPPITKQEQPPMQN